MMALTVDRQVKKIIGHHAEDPCIPWDAEQVDRLRSLQRVPQEMGPVAGEVIDRHDWVCDDCLNLTYPNRDRGEDLGQTVWLGVFEALVTPGREVRHLHVFIGGVMANQLKKLIEHRQKDLRLVPYEVETEEGTMEQRGAAMEQEPTVDELAIRSALIDKVLGGLDLYDRILLVGYMKGQTLKRVRQELLDAGDPRVTTATPLSNVKTYQYTALRRARRLLGVSEPMGDHERGQA